ncbi:retrovirus-related pol polyprotein from transposon TNT 1-94, partial [Tanacetum coccineum]
MLIDEKFNSDQKTLESNSKIQKAESSKSVDSSKISQDSKPKVQSNGLSKSLRPKRIQKPLLKCELCHYTNHSTDDCYRILYCMICKREDHRTSDHEMYIASLKRSENYKAQPYQYASSSKQILRARQSLSHHAHTMIRGGLLAESSQSNESSIGFDNKQGTIFNANKEIVLIAPKINDVYVLDMSSLTPNGACFFAKALESINWLWHKRLSRLNFKNINKLAKQNKVLGLPSLAYSKDKPCTSCEKGKHHRASFKTKQNFSIRKCLHLLHMDLFGPVSPMSINHEKYTIVIVDEYSRYTWVYFLRKKSQAPEMIMSFIIMVENQNDVKVKQIRTDNETKFRNHELKSFCDEKGISQNFFSPYTPEQNGVAERRNKTLIEAARTMLNGSVLSKHFWTDVFTNTLVDEIEIDDSSRYPPDEFQEDDPSRQYQVDSDDDEGPLDKINTEGTHEQNVQNDQMITQPTDVPSGNNTEDRWSRDQHIELVNIIGDPGKGMLTRSMAAKLTAASASECLFADFLCEIEPKKVTEALKHPRWIDAIQ